MVTKNESQFFINVYPSSKGLIGKFELANQDGITSTTTSDKSSQTLPEFIVLLDRSGSMGDNAKRLADILIPEILKELGYSNKKVHFITFDSMVDYYNVLPSEISALKITARGGTRMCQSVYEIQKVVKQSNNKFIRILTISDGDLDDQLETLKASSIIATELKSEFSVSSQAVRFFTSSYQPDTRGLSGFLQLNSSGIANLVDINSKESNDSIISLIKDLYSHDLLGNLTKLVSEAHLFKKSPWAEPTQSLYVMEGENTFWLKDIPESVKIEVNEVIYDVTVKICEDITYSNFESIMKSRIDYFFNQLKILKIVSTENSISELQKIVNYFTELESSLELKVESESVKSNSTSTSLQSRIEMFKNIITKRTRSVALRMAELAYDDKVNKLNSAQQADYLRNVENTKTSKGLVRRALGEGIDFDTVAREEAKKIHENIHELSDIDDSGHSVSFYSTCSTLDGIKSISDMVKSNLVDFMSANDILKLLNVVGIACESPIGDFPDPMTWWIDEIFYGCYVSMSDILMAFEVSGGKALKDVSTKKDIVNVIPFFDDERIHKFLLKYAPSLLEYTSSIGMRRIIANVPQTYNYNIVTGIWKMIQTLDNNRSNINIHTFGNLIKSYDTAIGKHFDYVLDLVKEQDTTYSYFISNNGVTNMISPLIKLCKSNNLTYMPNILRALYAFETYSYCRKQFRKAEDPNKYSTEFLNELLGVDFEKYKTPLPELFSEETDAKHHDNFYINEDKLKKLNEGCWWVDYLTLIPNYFCAAFDTNLTEAFNSIPKLSDEFMCKAFDIDYDIQTFKLFNYFQGFTARNKDQRVDEGKMKIIDLKNKGEAIKLIKSYVKGQYAEKYYTEYQLQIKEEKNIVADELVKMLVKADSIEKFIDLLKNGYTRGIRSHVISDSSKLGFLELKSRLFDLKEEIPFHYEKIEILLLGCDAEGNPVWNNNNRLRIDMIELENVFKAIGFADKWADLVIRIKSKKGHVYRNGLENRQGHSNEKPSYWGYGFKTLEEMISITSNEEAEVYKKVHFNCCGYAQVNKVVSFKKERRLRGRKKK